MRQFSEKFGFLLTHEKRWLNYLHINVLVLLQIRIIILLTKVKPLKKWNDVYFIFI